MLLRTRICPDKTIIPHFVGSCFSAQNAVLCAQWKPNPCSSWLSCAAPSFFWGDRDICRICGGWDPSFFPFELSGARGIMQAWTEVERRGQRAGVRGTEGPSSVVLAWARPLKAVQSSAWDDYRAVSGWFCPSVLCSV